MFALEKDALVLWCDPEGIAVETNGGLVAGGRVGEGSMMVAEEHRFPSSCYECVPLVRDTQATPSNMPRFVWC